MNLRDILRLVARRQPQEKGEDPTRKAMRKAIQDNERAVEELQRLLSSGARLRLVVEPPRQDNGQFKAFR
jgi:hypothetical protein